jgi:excisionase family DNA binding protein
MLPNRDTLTVDEVVKLTGLSRYTIRRRFRDGTLSGYRSKPGTGWLRIEVASLERYVGKRLTSAEVTASPAPSA